ncbi:MAG: proteasome-activating nucleotidase [Promethearchaeota archaeon]
MKDGGSQNAKRNQLYDLEERIKVLEDDKRNLEEKGKNLERHLFRTRKELRALQEKFERLKIYPLPIGTIEDVLPDGRAIVRSSAGPTFVVAISPSIPNNLIQVGARVALTQRTNAIMEVLPRSHDSFVRCMEVTEKAIISETYEDIGGLDKQIQEVREVVELGIKRSDLFRDIGIECPKGILLFGPPGTGKTLIGKAVAHACQATFIKVIGSELAQKYIGEGARLVRDIFNMAIDRRPTILFIDELDAIGSKRLDLSTSGDREIQRTMLQLLSLMDGFSRYEDVKFIAATNRPDILDPALVRSGRFDRHIEIPLPNEQARLEILRIHSYKMSLAENVNLKAIAEKTEGLSGADLKIICMESGMFAIRELRSQVIQRDFNDALDKILNKVRHEGQVATASFYS